MVNESINKRIAEHFLKSEKSSFCAHLKSTDHNFDPNSARLLHLGERGKRLTALEAVEIVKAKNNTDDFSDLRRCSAILILNPDFETPFHFFQTYCAQLSLPRVREFFFMELAIPSLVHRV